MGPLNHIDRDHIQVEAVGKAVQGAMRPAISVLQDERVKEQLRKAPGAARDCADSRRTSRSIETGASNVLTRFDPTQRFGQRGIECRLTALERNAERVTVRIDGRRCASSAAP